LKEIIDAIVVVLFVFMVAMFIINFNRQQIKKHTDRLEDRENQNKDKNNA
jgi:preprotein translocase subunit YajC